MAAGCAAPALEEFERGDIRVGDETLTVLLAESSAERQQGLTGVDSLPGGVDGMLFVFERSRSASFGMLGVPLALDIWWFDSNGVLLGSASMDPCPEEPCTDYASPGPVVWALETPSGEFDFQPREVLVPNVENG